ncbi:hypothetical protein FOZ61_000177 [Perkinsus olseni]|uniref:Uncharacterized protein n=1 Tax=Perkinsus olseni TaxID=32597 RepID=A0A7J6M0W2_PEROL|nr:hypothetical protein FOZ61_000177 [Perkinsus olseni]
MYAPASTPPLPPRKGDASPTGMSLRMMGDSPSGASRNERLNSSAQSISASTFSATAKREQIAKLRQRREFLARVDLLSRQNAAAGKPPVAPSPRGTPRDSLGGDLRDNEPKEKGVDTATETGVIQKQAEFSQTDELDVVSRKTQTDAVPEPVLKHSDDDYAELEKRLQEAQEDAMEQQRKAETSASVLADMNDQLRSAEDERDRARAELQEMDRVGPDQSIFEEREQELNGNLRNAEQTIFRLRAEVRELKAQKNALNFELDHLKASPLSPRSVSSDSPRSPIKPEYPDLRSDLEAEKAKSSGLSGDLQKLRAQIEALRDEKSHLAESLTREQARSEESGRALKEATALAEAKKQELNEQTERLARLEKLANAETPSFPPSRVTAEAPPSGASKPVQKVDTKPPVADAKAPVTDATAPEAVPDKEALKGNAKAPVVDARPPPADTKAPVVDARPPPADTKAPVVDARPPPADTKAPVVEARPPPADTKALVMDKKVPVVESKSPSGVPKLMVTSTEGPEGTRKPSTFSADSADVADEGTAEDIRTADVSHDSLHKHSSEPKLADAAGKGKALASPVDQQRTADGRQTPPDDFWGSDTASPIVGHGVSNTGNAAVFAISTPDGDHVQPKGAQGATVSFSPETTGGERGRAGSLKGGAKQKKGDDSGDTSFTRRSTGVATLFEDDEVSTSAIFGPGNAKDDGLDFDSILNSEPSTPFMQGPGQQGPAQYTNGPNYQQQQPAPGARPYGSRSGQSSGYSSAANSMGSWNNSNSSWNYVEQQQPRQQQQSPYTSSSSGGSFPAQQPNSPYPTSARGQGAPYNQHTTPQQQGWGARPAQQAYQGSQQQQNRWQPPSTPPQNGVGLRPYNPPKPGFGGLQRR